MTARRCALSGLLPLVSLLGLACEGGSLDPSDSEQPASDDDATPIDDDTTPSGDDDATAGDDDTTPIEGPSYTTGMGPLTFRPGDEDTFCVEKRLTNEEAVLVHRISTEINEGGHHTIVYRSTATEERAEPFRCFPFIETLGGENTPVMITQIREEELRFPTRTALRFEPHQMVRLESHFLNVTDHDIEAYVDVEFGTIDASQVDDEVDFIFLGTVDMEIPPGEAYTLGPRFVGFPDSMAGIEVFAATGHTHQYGTDVTLWRSEDFDDLDEPVYPTVDHWYWDEPEVAYYDPPLVFPEDSGVSIQCSWENTSDEWLYLGESAEDEMCFAWAYYYPSQGYKLCVETSYLGASISLCCPSEDPLCEYLYDYLGF